MQGESCRPLVLIPIQMTEKLVYKVDESDLQQLVKTLRETAKAAGLAESEIDGMVKSAEGNFKKIGKSADDMPKKFGGIGTAAKGAGALMVAAFAVDVIIDYGKELLNLEREFSKLRGQVQRFSNQTGAALDKSVVKVKSLSNVFEKDLNDVLVSANAFSKQMGISFDESLSLIEKGFLNGADVSGDFLDKVKEYPVQFREAGFSAEEFIKIATQEANSGIYSDKLLDTVKELGLSLRELTKTQVDALRGAFGNDFTNKFIDDIRRGRINVKEAFFQIQEESKKLNLSVQQTQTLTADLFKGAGEDAGGFEEVIKQVNLALSTNIDELDKLGKKEAQNLVIQEEYNTAVNELTRNLEGSGQVIGNFFTKVLTVSANALSEVIKFFDIANARAESFARDQLKGFAEKSDEELKASLERSEKRLLKIADLEKKFAGDDNKIRIAKKERAEREAFIELAKEELATRERMRALEEQRKKAEEDRIERLKQLFGMQLKLTKSEKESVDYAKTVAKTERIIQGEKDKTVEIQKVGLGELSEAFGGINDMQEALQAGTLGNITTITNRSTELNKLTQDQLDEYLALQQENMQIALGTLASSVGSLGDAIGGGFGEFLGFAGKVISTLNAIAAAESAISIAKQAGREFPTNIIAIAATLTAITSGISTIKSAAKFATGTKFVDGPGTETSDSVPAMLSRGERVETAQTNRLYGSAIDLFTDRKISPELAEAALNLAMGGGMKDLGALPSQGGQTQYADGTRQIVDAINNKKSFVDIHVSKDGIGVGTSNGKHTRFANRYSFKG